MVIGVWVSCTANYAAADNVVIRDKQAQAAIRFHLAQARARAAGGEPSDGRSRAADPVDGNMMTMQQQQPAARQEEADRCT